MPIAKAVRIKEAGGVDVLHIDRISVPEPHSAEVLVEVAAAGLNRADILQRKGLYPAPKGVPSDVPGLEYAGRIAAVGEHVSHLKVGDNVMGIVGGGAMATHLIAHEREVLPIPDGVDLWRAAAIPEAFLTAYDALFLQAGLCAGESVLIHACASGIGTAASQLVRWAGGQAFGTSRTEGKLRRCEAWGLQHGVLVSRQDPNFLDAIRAQNDDKYIDVILDLVGGAYLKENIDALAYRGRMVTIGLLGGIRGELALNKLMTKRLRLFGSVLRSRPLEEKAALTADFAAKALPAFGPDGSLGPVIDEILPMSKIQEAHERMEHNDTFGKLVMSWA